MVKSFLPLPGDAGGLAVAVRAGQRFREATGAQRIVHVARLLQPEQGVAHARLHVVGGGATILLSCRALADPRAYWPLADDEPSAPTRPRAVTADSGALDEHDGRRRAAAPAPIGQGTDISS